MDKFAITIFRYKYREPQGKIPCDYLESTQNLRTLFMQTGLTPLRIVCREVGGSSDNHVQWVSVDKIVPVGPDDNGNGHTRDGEENKRDVSTVFRGVGYAHGVIRHPSWQHSVGDKIWLRSDMPLFKGRKSVPIVNLTQARSAEAFIRDIDWIPQKRSKGGPPGSPPFLLTIAGPKYASCPPTTGPQRMAIVIDRLKEIHAPLPAYTYAVPPPLAITYYIHSYGVSTFEPPSLSPAERELELALERVDEVRARLDNDTDHYTLKVVSVDELEAGFEDVVDLVEVSVVTPGPNTGRRVPAGPKAENEGGDENERAGNDSRNRMLVGLVAAFSEENSSLDLDLAAAKRK